MELESAKCEQQQVTHQPHSLPESGLLPQGKKDSTGTARPGWHCQGDTAQPSWDLPNSTRYIPRVSLGLLTLCFHLVLRERHAFPPCSEGEIGIFTLFCGKNCISTLFWGRNCISIFFFWGRSMDFHIVLKEKYGFPHCSEGEIWKYGFPYCSEGEIGFPCC